MPEIRVLDIDSSFDAAIGDSRPRRAGPSVGFLDSDGSDARRFRLVPDFRPSDFGFAPCRGIDCVAFQSRQRFSELGDRCAIARPVRQELRELGVRFATHDRMSAGDFSPEGKIERARRDVQALGVGGDDSHRFDQIDATWRTSISGSSSAAQASAPIVRNRESTSVRSPRKTRSPSSKPQASVTSSAGSEVGANHRSSMPAGRIRAQSCASKGRPPSGARSLPENEFSHPSAIVVSRTHRQNTRNGFANTSTSTGKSKEFSLIQL